MTIHHISLASIQLSDSNPRAAIDPAGIESLAASILNDGLLQNLVVVPLDGLEAGYRLVSGERRYRALQWLHERGDIPADYSVPVDIRFGLSGSDTLRLATVENVQREDLSPLEEASAFVQLIQHGAALEDISAQTGVSRTTIKRRLALASLCEEAKQALAGGEITLALAEAFTLGTREAQRELLARLDAGYHYAAEDIREMLLQRRPTVAMARFPLEQYQGSFTADLFAEEATTYFDDVEQFFALQQQAVAALAERYAETADWVEVTEHYHIPRWQYRPAEDGEAAGVLVNLSPSGDVEVVEGLARRDLAPGMAAKTAETPLAPKPKPAYSAALCRDLAYHKSMAMQHLLLANPRQAKEVAVLSLLGASDYVSKVQISLHECLGAFTRAEQPPASYRAVERQAQRLAYALGLASDDEECTGWERLLRLAKDETALYDAVKTLSDEDLDQLHLLLTVLCFGQGNCHQLDTGDTLFNRMARDLSADMRAYWRPDAEFLARRTRDQLLQVASESGLTARLGHPSRMKKAELVKALAREFSRVHDLADPSEADRRALDWLPEAMRFPAIDPAAPDEADDDTGEAPFLEALAA